MIWGIRYVQQDPIFPPSLSIKTERGYENWYDPTKNTWHANWRDCTVFSNLNDAYRWYQSTQKTIGHPLLLHCGGDYRYSFIVEEITV